MDLVHVMKVHINTSVANNLLSFFFFKCKPKTPSWLCYETDVVIRSIYAAIYMLYVQL